MSNNPFNIDADVTYRTLSGPISDEQWRIRVGKYDLSVVRGPHTYGGRDGLYELAVINPEGRVDYDTPVTDDVLGWLTAEKVKAVHDAFAKWVAGGAYIDPLAVSA